MLDNNDITQEAVKVGAVRQPWSVVVLMKNPAMASSLLRILMDFKRGQESFAVQQINTPEEARWALHHLRTQQHLPHLVLYDAFNIALQSGFLLALQDFPEIGKVLLSDDLQLEVLTLAIDTCGVDLVMTVPFVPRQLLQLLDRLRGAWTPDGARPLRLEAESSTQELSALTSQNSALARANVRTLDVIGALEQQVTDLAAKEASLRRMISMLAAENMAGDGLLVQGSLAECPLLDLLQTLVLANQSSKVVLLHNAQKAVLHLWDGELLHAQCDGLVGRSALDLCFGWEWGEYFVEPSDTPSERTIFAPTESLLFGIRAADSQHESLTMS